MTLKDLKEFINHLPDTFDDYTIENAEYLESSGDDVTYRLDKPIVAIYVKEETKEILIMNEPMEQYK